MKHKRGSSSSSSNWVLITLNVMGSPGPLRFLVREEELVATVIKNALRSYAHQGRLPILGSEADDFLLYCTKSDYAALSPSETIGSRGTRDFLLCKKKNVVADAPKSQPPNRATRSSWSFFKYCFKISSH